jgi:NADH:ubiquinone oxidoreductase subunit 4 (subunit M)
MSLAEQSVKLMIFLSSSIILTVAFSLWFLNRTQFGTLQVQYKSNTSDISMIDLTEAEFRTMKYLCLIIILLGIYPELYLDLIRDDSTFILSWILSV